MTMKRSAFKRIVRVVLGIIIAACVITLFGVVGSIETGEMTVKEAFGYVGAAFVIGAGAILAMDKMEDWR